MNPFYLIKEGMIRIWYVQTPEEGVVQYRVGCYSGLNTLEIQKLVRPLCQDFEFVKTWGTKCDTHEEIDELHSTYTRHLRYIEQENQLAMSLECADH